MLPAMPHYASMLPLKNDLCSFTLPKKKEHVEQKRSSETSVAPSKNSSNIGVTILKLMRTLGFFPTIGSQFRHHTRPPALTKHEMG